MKWECKWKNKVWVSDCGYVITKNYSSTMGGTLPYGIEFWVYKTHEDHQKGINLKSFFPEINYDNGQYSLVSNPKLKEVKEWVFKNVHK